MYGVRITDGSDVLLLSSALISVVSAGRTSMPAALEGDNTYGIDIDLPGVDAIAEASLGVIAKSFRVNANLFVDGYDLFDCYAWNWEVANAYTFYTRNESTGVMTVWTPVITEPNQDSVLSIYPVAFWDKLGGSTFTAIRIFAATCYLVYDASASAYIRVYTIHDEGVEDVDYAISMKKYPTV